MDLSKSEVITITKALIITKKGGLPIEDLNNEFQEMEGIPLPYLRLGFPSLFHFLRSVPEIKVTKNQLGAPILKVEEEKISHLNTLIQGQKPAKNQRNRRCSRKSSNRKNRRPAPYERKKSARYNDSGSLSDFEEVQQPPQILIDSRRNVVDVHEPMLNGKQLIGDDFLLQLAIRNMGVPIWRKAENSALYAGLCVSGMTIMDCVAKLQKVDSIADKVTIQLGSVDIYRGRNFEQMKNDYRELLDLLEVKFNLSRSSISICTLPPLANLSYVLDFDKSSNLRLFNAWLRQIVREEYDFVYGTYSAYHLVDIYQHYTDDVGKIEYQHFQNDARNVSGTRYSYVLWNKKGRKKAMELLYY